MRVESRTSARHDCCPSQYCSMRHALDAITTARKHGLVSVERPRCQLRHSAAYGSSRTVIEGIGSASVEVSVPSDEGREETEITSQFPAVLSSELEMREGSIAAMSVETDTLMMQAQELLNQELM